jgi:hypothetical protein
VNTLLAGCVGSAVDDGKDDSSHHLPPTTRADDARERPSIRITVESATVAPGTTITLSVHAQNIRRLAWAAFPQRLNPGELLGDIQFEPHVSGMLKSLPPVYLWNPLVDTVTGTIEINVPDTASSGRYVLGLVASNESGTDTGTIVLHVGENAKSRTDEAETGS